MDPNETPECWAMHTGIWLCEPAWLHNMVAAVKMGLLIPRPVAAVQVIGGNDDVAYTRTDDGVAVIRMVGPILKGQSKFGGVSSIATRQAIRQAARDESVKAILLAIDSPGGTAAGTAELADEVRKVVGQMPVHAYLEDMGASAAYWIASQASRISSNRSAEVGSIGTVAIVEDSSGQFAKDGIQVHVIATGPYKGAFVEGAPVTQDQLAYLKERVDAINSHFVSAVQAGRRFSADTLSKVTDGKVYPAEQARSLGLTDAVESYDAAYGNIVAVITQQARDAKLRNAQLSIAK